MYITLNKLIEWKPCEGSYEKVVGRVGENYDKDKPIYLSDIFEPGDIRDAFWCLQKMDLTPEQKIGFRLLACDFAERVLPIYEKEYPDDSRIRNCIEISRKFALGKATKKELMDAAEAAAWAAARAARAAEAAAWAAWAAGDAERAEQEKLLLTYLNKHEVKE